MGKKDKKKTGDNVIAANRKARHDYFIDETFEAGLALEGWEVRWPGTARELYHGEGYPAICSDFPG